MVLVASSYWNILVFIRNTANMPVREFDEMVVQENRFREIRAQLTKVGYRSGKIGYVTPRDLKGETRTAKDDQNWGEAQYVMAPLVLVRDAAADSPYVIGEFSAAQSQPPVPDDLLKLYDAGNGLVLFQRKTPH